MMRPMIIYTNINARERVFVRLSRSHDLCLLNYGSLTYLRKCSSCLDLAFVSKSLYPSVQCFTDLEARGSDHIPTYTSINLLLNQCRRWAVKITDWFTFRTTRETTTAGDLESFENAIVFVAQNAKSCASYDFAIKLVFKNVYRLSSLVGFGGGKDGNC